MEPSLKLEALLDALESSDDYKRYQGLNFLSKLSKKDCQAIFEDVDSNPRLWTRFSSICLHHIDDLTASLEKEDGDKNGDTEHQNRFPKSQFAPGRPIAGENLLRPKKKETTSFLRSRLGEVSTMKAHIATTDPLDKNDALLPTLFQTQPSAGPKRHLGSLETRAKVNGGTSRFREIAWIAWILEFFDFEKPRIEENGTLPFLVSDFQAHLWNVNGIYFTFILAKIDGLCLY